MLIIFNKKKMNKNREVKMDQMVIKLTKNFKNLGQVQIEEGPL